MAVQWAGSGAAHRRQQQQQRAARACDLAALPLPPPTCKLWSQSSLQCGGVKHVAVQPQTLCASAGAHICTQPKLVEQGFDAAGNHGSGCRRVTSAAVGGQGVASTGTRRGVHITDLQGAACLRRHPWWGGCAPAPSRTAHSTAVRQQLGACPSTHPPEQLQDRCPVCHSRGPHQPVSLHHATGADAQPAKRVACRRK